MQSVNWTQWTEVNGFVLNPKWSDHRHNDSDNSLKEKNDNFNLFKNNRFICKFTDLTNTRCDHTFII